MNRLLLLVCASWGIGFLSFGGANGEELVFSFQELDTQSEELSNRTIQLETIPLLDLTSESRPAGKPLRPAISLPTRLQEVRQFVAMADETSPPKASSEKSSSETTPAKGSDDVAKDDAANGAPTAESRRAVPVEAGETITPSLIPMESASPADSTGPEPSPKLVLSAESEQRLLKVRKVLDVYRPKLLNTRDQGPWETMHAIIAYGVDTKVRRNGPDGEPVTAIGWLTFNNPAAGQRLFYARREGGVGALTGPGLQGHAGQFLAIVAQCRLDRKYPIQAEGKQFTIDDLIKFEQDTCQPKTELTFKLISLAHYLDSDATWTNENGQSWNIQRLIREELAQPINGVACGGTHRLFGLSYAVYQRAKQGKPMVGEFARAKKFIHDYHNYTYALQNSDGSFSTNWFKGREDRADLDRRLQTTGHILEWMAFSSPREDLQNPRLVKAVDYLADIMLANPNHSWPLGPRGHALHAMAIYESRLSRPAEKAIPTAVETPSQSNGPEIVNRAGTVSVDSSAVQATSAAARKE